MDVSVTPDVDAGEALDTNATTDKEIDSSDEAKNPTEDKSSADEDADDENADEKKEAADDGSTEEDDSEDLTLRPPTSQTTTRAARVMPQRMAVPPHFRQTLQNR